MHPGKYEYLSAESVDHAVNLMEEHPDAELLAGGHSLLPAITREEADPDVVIDISEIDAIRGIEVGDGVVKIGAVTRYVDLETSEELRNAATVLWEAVCTIGDEQVRNRGTIGGNLAHPVRVSDLSAAIIASEATIMVTGPAGDRQISADEFFDRNRDADIATNEIVTQIVVPMATENIGEAYSKKQSKTARYTLLGVAVRLCVEQGRVSNAWVAANGVTRKGICLSAVEDALRGERLDEDTIQAAASKAANGIDTAVMIDDKQASATYRARLLPTYTERALVRAAESAGVEIAV